MQNPAMHREWENSKHCQGKSQKLHTANWSTVDGHPKQQGEKDTPHTEDFLSFISLDWFFFYLLLLT